MRNALQIMMFYSFAFAAAFGVVKILESKIGQRMAEYWFGPKGFWSMMAIFIALSILYLCLYGV